MRQKITELHNTLHSFVLTHCIDKIPQQYFEEATSQWTEMIKNGHDWDRYKAAALLLASCVKDGYIGESEITPNGHKAMAWVQDTMNTSEDN